MVSLGLIFIVLLIIIIAIAAMATKVNTEREGGEGEMIKKVYVYLVLFATLMMVIGGSVSAFMAVSDIVAPAPYYQSFEEFSNWKVEKPSLDANVKPEKYTAEELDTMYEAMVKSESERQQGRAYNTLVKSFGWIIIPLPVFIYFQKKLAKNDEMI